MQRCLQLAQLGLGKTAPNPMVGSVIVWKDQIIGEGYHHAAGLAHAEVEAINMVSDISKLSDSTVYVNLEPCNHSGKTPPCTDLIITHKIPRVVVGQEDPNPLVAGKGLERLRKSGVDVTDGIMEQESRELNRRFNVFHSLKRPYILLKWAQTKDGFIDHVREADQTVKPKWITDEYCRMHVHKWRTEEPAILIGTRTAILDNPKLNIRSWIGKAPIRLILDRHSSLPKHLHIFDQSQETWVFSEKNASMKKNLETIQIQSGKPDLEQLMSILYVRQVQSVMVEGGAELLDSFIQENLWDEARVFTGPGTFGNGVKGPHLSSSPETQKQMGNSLLEIFRNR